MRALRYCSSSLREVGSSLTTSEVVISRLDALKREARRYATDPATAERITRWTLRPMHYHLPGSDRDVGFVIPDMIRSMSNLTYLNIGTEHRSGSVAESVVRGGRSFDFESFTGGVSVPDTIVASLPNLRELIYGVPTTFDAVVKFATAIPSLRELSVLDEVERLDEPVVVTRAPPGLRRLWLPTTILTSAELGKLLGIGVTSSASGESEAHAGPSTSATTAATTTTTTTTKTTDWEGAPRPKLEALAFCFDADQVFTDPAPSEQELADECLRLEHIFLCIGPNLVDLQISTVGADDPYTVGGLLLLQAAGIQTLRRRRGPVRGQGGGGGPRGGMHPPAVTVAFAFGGPNPPAAAPQPPPGVAPGPAAPPPATAQPARAQQPPNAMLPALGAGLRNLLGLGGGGGGGGGANAGQARPHHGVRPAPNNANANMDANANGNTTANANANGNANANATTAAPAAMPQRAARRTGIPGGGGLPPPGAGGGAGGLPGGINIVLGNGHGATPATPFFAEMVVCCPKLERLELFGRRYDASLMHLLRTRPLRRLALSVPNDNVREAVVEELLASIASGAWPEMNRCGSLTLSLSLSCFLPSLTAPHSCSSGVNPAGSN